MSDAKYYQDITDTPLRAFIEVVANDNISALIISGFPEKEELEEAWSQILSQYQDAIGDGESKVYMALFKEVTNLSLDIDMVTEMVKNLRAVPDIPDFFLDDYVRSVYKKCGDELNKILSTTFEFNLDDHDALNAELTRCVNRSKSLLINHEIKSKRLKEMEAERPEGKKPTKGHFLSMLQTLSKGEGYKLTIDSETVFEFCELVRRYNLQVEQAARDASKRDNR